MSVLCVWEGVGALVPLYMCGGKETTWEHWILLLTYVGQEMALMESGWVANAFPGTPAHSPSSPQLSSQDSCLIGSSTSQFGVRQAHGNVDGRNPIPLRSTGLLLHPVCAPSPQPFSPVLFSSWFSLERLSVCFTRWLLMVFLSSALCSAEQGNIF